MNEIFNFKKIYRAYLDCRKNKRNTINALKFEIDLENNLMVLLKELATRTYSPGRSICFVVEEPTIREIFAADFRDRIVHHLLVNEIINGGERKFSFDSFACRKNKGAHKAVERLYEHMRKASENFSTETWCAQLDISGFFMSISHNNLFKFLEALVNCQNKSEQWKEGVLWLGKTFIYNRPTENYIKKGNPSLFLKVPRKKSLFYSGINKGLPIGNYTSQFFANLYLNELDQYIKRSLAVKHYLRYVDDFIFFGKSKNELEEIIEKIRNFLATNLALEIHPKKIKIQRIEEGIDFLGYFVKPDYSLVRRRVVKKLKAKLYEANSVETHNYASLQSMINSYYGHFRNVASYNLRRDIYDNHLGALKERFEPKERLVALKLRNEN